MTLPHKTLLRFGLLLSVLVLVVVVYWVGVGGPFVFDDAPNITENPAMRVQALDYHSLKTVAFSVPAGPLYRPISMASFAINYYFSGESVEAYKLTNICIHLLAGLGVVWVASLLMRLVPEQSRPCQEWRWLISIFVGALWLLHPLNLSSVLYVVQRMNSLASMFLFFAFAFYLKGRLYQQCLESSHLLKTALCWFVSACVIFPLAVFSKENALLLPFLILATEELLLRWQSTGRVNQSLIRGLRILLWLGVVVVFVAFLFAFFGSDYFERTYDHRSFSLKQRVLTEPKILLHYLSWILLPNIDRLTFYHDDIVLINQFWGGGILYIGAWAALLGAGVLLRKRFIWLLFALVWFLVGHVMESSVIALELAHEHRNYVPMFGVLLMAGMLFGKGFGNPSRRSFASVLAVLLVVVLALGTHARATSWRDFKSLAERHYRLNPDEFRANLNLGRYWFSVAVGSDDRQLREALYPKIVDLFSRTSELEPNDFSGLLGIVRIKDQMGYPGDEAVLEQACNRISTKSLGMGDLNHVQDLLNCQLTEDCSLDVGTLQRIVTAILSNPTLPQPFQAAINSNFGTYLLVNRHFQLASHYLVQATILGPDLWETRASALDSLIQTNNKAGAESILRDIEARDIPSELRSVFARLKKQVMQLD